ncbi:hypothetical protein GQ53DRAFT_816725 [Thozetella sp. PMI_491]|nr:hypothetical protein GQ53DRAFT_816725 [Thozetella sp. PMI_491]
MDLVRDAQDPPGPSAGTKDAFEPKVHELVPGEQTAAAQELQARGPTTSPALIHSPRNLQHSTSTTTPTSQMSPVAGRSRVAVMLNSSPTRHSFVKPSPEPDNDDSRQLEGITSDSVGGYQTAIPAAMATPTVPAASQPQQVPHNIAAPIPTSEPSLPEPPATQVKKRGRPVGWRQGMGPYSAKTSGPGGSSVNAKAKTSADSKRRGRPGRPPKDRWAVARAVYRKLRPKFIVFLCEWEGCPAELQNFETLRKHILVVHGGSTACKWAACAKEPRGPELGTWDTFEEHMEREHLVPFIWHVGEGPQNDADRRAQAAARLEEGDNAPLPGYLFDKDGNQMTPSVRGQLIETEEERRERRRRLHRFLAERDRNAPDDEEELTPGELAELEAMFAAKQLK